MTHAMTPSAPHLHTYEDALAHIGERFARLTADTSLFTTDAAGLWTTYILNIDSDRRQHYWCRACQHFIERYGGLAVVVDGRVRSALWSDDLLYPHGLTSALNAMRRAVERSKITGVFVGSATVIGTPLTIADTTLTTWHHFSAQLPARHVNCDPIRTAGQVMAAKREEYEMLSRSFGDFSLATVQTAHELLASGRLYRSEKCEGVAKWLLDLRERREAANYTATRENVTWLAVADAPAGFCHVRSGMIGTLLEDIEAGLPFDAVKARFDAKMHPLQYLRPQAPPSAGTIAQAEKIVAMLRSAGALDRRFARLEEADALWLPTPPAEVKPNASAPVFGHLLGKRDTAPSQTLPAVTMTWVKFRDTVLSTAASMEFRVDGLIRKGYCAIVTAANPEAPPILQYDREDRRNPASQYVYSGGSYPDVWNLKHGWVKVTALTLLPANWYGNKAPNQGNGVIAILDGARDTKHTAGAGFFPEILRSEYHSIRSVMEAYARQATIAGRDEATACGIMMAGAGTWSGITFRVTTSTGLVATYNLDRWD